MAVRCECNATTPHRSLQVLLVQLEVKKDAVVAACQHAHTSGNPVAFKASPLSRGDAEAKRSAEAVLDSGVSLAFVNDVEAVALLGEAYGEGGRLLTVMHAEAAAAQMLERWPALRTVVVTCVTAHVLLERWPSAWRTEEDCGIESATSGAGKADGSAGVAGSFVNHVLPRNVDNLVRDVIGAAEYVPRSTASSHSWRPHQQLNPCAQTCSSILCASAWTQRFCRGVYCLRSRGARQHDESHTRGGRRHSLDARRGRAELSPEEDGTQRLRCTPAARAGAGCRVRRSAAAAS